jgi:hypothetical protein
MAPSLAYFKELNNAGVIIIRHEINEGLVKKGR